MPPIAPRNLSRIERKLVRYLSRLTKWVREISKSSLSLEEMTSRIGDLADTTEWKAIVWASCIQMVKSVAIQDAPSWREAARRGTNGQLIHRALSAEMSTNTLFHELIESNAQWIKSMPRLVANQVTAHASTIALRGLRPDVLMHQLKQDAPHLTDTHIRLIARTETAKAQANIVQSRSQRVGVNWYQWSTVHDQRVRHAHEHMEGVWCNYNDPPSPEQLDPEYRGKQFKHYNPGNYFNCRCRSSSLALLPEMRGPFKVHINGKIDTKAKREFLAMLNSTEREFAIL